MPDSAWVEKDPYLTFLAARPALAARILFLERMGHAALRKGELARAEKLLRRALRLCPVSPMAHNNLGACLLAQGRPTEARAHFEATLEHYPDYVFALAMLSRCAAALGETDLARRLLRRAVDACRPTNPYRGDETDAIPAVIDAFADLNDDRGLLEFFSRHGGPRVPPHTLARVGVAAFNRGRYAQARRHWQQAKEQNGDLRLLDALAFASTCLEQGHVPPFRLPYDLELPRLTRPDDPAMLHGPMKALAIYHIWNGPDDVRRATLTLLEQNPDPWGELLLRGLLKVAELPTDVKHAAAFALLRRGSIAPGETVTMNIDGRMQPVQLHLVQVPQGVNPEAVLAFHQGLAHRRHGRLAEAEAAYRWALELEPGLTVVKVNLANVYRAQGRLDEALRLLQQAVQEEPDSSLVCLNYAGLLAQLERWDEVEAPLLQVQPEELEEDGRWRYYYLLAALRLRQGNEEQARDAVEKGLRLAPDEEARESLKSLKRATNEAGPFIGALRGLAKRFESMKANRRRRLLKEPVRPGMALEEAYLTQTMDNLVGMARLRGLRRPAGMGKAGLVQLLAQDMRRRLTEYMGQLDERRLEALRWVHEQGGAAPFEAFEKRFGDPRAALFWETATPQAPGLWLWAFGWVAAGTWYGDGSSTPQTVVVLPAEVQAALESGGSRKETPGLHPAAPGPAVAQGC